MLPLQLLHMQHKLFQLDLLLLMKMKHLIVLSLPLDLTILLFLMDTLGFLKYHSLQCDGHTADVIFQGTAIGINYKMAKRNIPVNRFFWPCLGKFRILPMCFFIVSTSRLISSSCTEIAKKPELKGTQLLPAIYYCCLGSTSSPVLDCFLTSHLRRVIHSTW